MKLYKFRPLTTCCDYDRIISIISDGFYCCDFLDFNDANEGVFRVSKRTINVELDQKREYRICSFSEEIALKCQLMWGHYAGAGMGVAIEIDKHPHDSIKDVKYDEVNKGESIIEILTNKSPQWCYEKEWRLILKSHNIYHKLEIKKVLFGTPYKRLNNYGEFKEKHRKLREFLKYSVSLKTELDKLSIPHDDYQDF